MVFVNNHDKQNLRLFLCKGIFHSLMVVHRICFDDLKTCYEFSVSRCVFETQMPPIMINFKDGQGHKEKYLDISRNILSEVMLMYNIKALIFIKT